MLGVGGGTLPLRIMIISSVEAAMGMVEISTKPSQHKLSSFFVVKYL
jgi:hypothetical protein